MRTSKRKQLIGAQRKALDGKRSAESRARKAKRKEKGKTEDVVAVALHGGLTNEG